VGAISTYHIDLVDASLNQPVKYLVSIEAASAGAEYGPAELVDVLDDLGL